MGRASFSDGSSTVAWFFNWINERHAIYLRKERGDPFPWTEDPILQEFKFTNAFRELDTGTKFYKKWNVGTLNTRIFNTFLYRMINNVGTFEEVDPSRATWPGMREQLRARWRRGDKVFTSAHMTTSRAYEDKIETVIKTLDSVENALFVQGWKPLEAESLEALFKTIRARRFYGVGPFIAYEIVCDLRFFPEWSPSDVLSWSNIGPGARRGLKRLGMAPKLESMVELYKMAEETELLQPWVSKHHRGLCDWNGVATPYPFFELREIEHSLCEFDKYERVRLKQGKPRERYVHRGTDESTIAAGT